jgi:hypothetical protein
MDYEIGSLVEYRLWSGAHRRVRVNRKIKDIKPGCDGFDGIAQDGKSYWGYDHQITRVLDLNPYKAGT